MPNFGLPSTVLVNRAMPKKAFYEHLKVTGETREQFVRLIEHIELVAAIKEASAHIPAGAGVAEIDVLALSLRDGEAGPAVPYEAIDLIASSIPNKLLFACLAGDGTCKLLVKRDRLYETAWQGQGDTDIELNGSHLGEVWDSMCSQVVFGAPDPADFAERLGRKRRIGTLKAELEKLKRKQKNESQIAKRNKIFDQIRLIKAELHTLEVDA